MAHQRGPDLPEPGELSAGARGQMHETWLEAYRQSWSICSRSETCTRPSGSVPIRCVEGSVVDLRGGHAVGDDRLPKRLVASAMIRAASSRSSSLLKQRVRGSVWDSDRWQALIHP